MSLLHALQRRQRAKIEAGKPQWPWRLALMAAKIHARKQLGEKARAAAAKQLVQPKAPRIRGEGMQTLHALSGLAAMGGGIKSRSWDPRG